jgi:hypothetical protein
MPTLSFTPDNKTEFASDFPRLKLDQNERKRILCLQEPNFGYVHTFRAPKIVNGKPEYASVKQKDGSFANELVKDFIGRPMCLGDLGLLQDKGVDAVNCPACERAIASDEIDRPQRRFAMPVIVYQTKPGGFDVASPFGCSCVVWNFTDMVFNKLVDIKEEWGSLRDVDLKLGPCENKVFQKYDISAAREAAWKTSEDRTAQVVACFKENQPKDIDALIGRRIERTWMTEDLNKVAARWRIVNGAPPVHDTDGATESLADGLAGLDAALTTPTAAAPSQKLDIGDVFGSGAITVSTDPTTHTVNPTVVNFNDLIDGL